MGRKAINQKTSKPYNLRRARRREQRRAFRKRFKAIYNQDEPEDLGDYYYPEYEPVEPPNELNE